MLLRSGVGDNDSPVLGAEKAKQVSQKTVWDWGGHLYR
jgi:hypothetical protein